MRGFIRGLEAFFLSFPCHSRSGFATPTGTFEDRTDVPNVSDGVTNPVALRKSSSFRHGLPEPSHMEVNLRVGEYLESDTYITASYRPWHWIPASPGIPCRGRLCWNDGTTAWRDLCITTSAERGSDQNPTYRVKYLRLRLTALQAIIRL